MTELKAINLNSMGCYNISKPVYLKSEAAKVIAELKRQIEFLEVTHDACGNCNKCAEGMGKVFDKNLNELKANIAQLEDDVAFWKTKAKGENVPTEIKTYTVFTPMDGTAEGIGESDSILIEGKEVCLKSETDRYIANMVAEHEAELDKWYAKLCRNRWRRAYAMYQHCCAMNSLECDTTPSTMDMHQFWRYHTAYWPRWIKRWLKVYLEYKERIE